MQNDTKRQDTNKENKPVTKQHNGNDTQLVCTKTWRDGD